MTTEIATTEAWDPNSNAPLPAYLSGALDEMGTNMPDRDNVPTLSYEGKVWTIKKDNNKTKLQAKNSDGDMVPVPVMRVVLLKFNADRGRAYYEGTYDPSKVTAPKCWSADGKKPDESVVEKQSTTCAGCPMSVKGSKVADGKEMVACSSHRMIAVAPAFEMDADPLRLKIAVTSDWDKDVVEHGHYAFRQYVDYLKSRGITHTALVVTKIKFDPNVAYPKLLFALDRVMTAAEVATIQVATKNPKVDEMLNEKWTAAGADGTKSDESDIAPHGLEGAYADGWIAHPDAPGYSYKGTEVKLNEVVAAMYPAPEPKAPPIPAAEQVIDNTPTPPVAPDVPAAPIAADAPVWNPIQKAEDDGWIKHPSAPDYHYKGSDVVLSTEVAEKYPAPGALIDPPANPAPPVPAAPVVTPAPAPAPQQTPLELAVVDGWVEHPTAPGYYYKGQDVVLTADVEAKYPGNGSSAGATAQAPTPTGSAQTAGATSSPSATGVIPAEVADVLAKWTS